MNYSREYRQNNLPLFFLDNDTVYVANLKIPDVIPSEFQLHNRSFYGSVITQDFAQTIIDRLEWTDSPYIWMSLFSYYTYENVPPSGGPIRLRYPDQEEH